MEDSSPLKGKLQKLKKKVESNLLKSTLNAHFHSRYRDFDRITDKFSNYSFPIDHYKIPQRLYDDICSRLPDFRDIFDQHLRISGHSNSTQMVIFNMLLDGSKEWNLELYNQLAQLLSSISGVESAGVPFDLKVGGNGVG